MPGYILSQHDHVHYFQYQSIILSSEVQKQPYVPSSEGRYNIVRCRLVDEVGTAIHVLYHCKYNLKSKLLIFDDDLFARTTDVRNNCLDQTTFTYLVMMERAQYNIMSNRIDLAVE